MVFTEERFVIGEIDRNLYQKFRPKYEQECFETGQELGKTGGYKSNLAKVANFAAKACLNPLIIWEKSDFNRKRAFQKLLFSEGIIYSRESDCSRTFRVNSLFLSPIQQLARGMSKQKSGNSIKIDKIPAWDHPSGEVSNFLIEDFEGVLNFMNARQQNKTLRM